MCGCKKTIIIENSPDCFRVGSGLFCKNCYFLCPCCGDIYNKKSDNYRDLTDELISNCDCENSKYNKHLEKYGEFAVCVGCADEENEGCSCGCGDFIFCCECQVIIGCYNCENKYFEYCAEEEIYWCENCEELSCRNCKKHYKINTDNGFNIRCSACVSEI